MDIYYKDFIYIDVDLIMPKNLDKEWMDEHLVTNFHSFPCQQPHNFNDGQIVERLNDYAIIQDNEKMEAAAVPLPAPEASVDVEEKTDDTFVLGFNNGRISFVKTFNYKTEEDAAKKSLAYVQDESKFTGWRISHVGGWIMESKNDSKEFFSISVPL